MFSERVLEMFSERVILSSAEFSEFSASSLVCVCVACLLAQNKKGTVRNTKDT